MSEIWTHHQCTVNGFRMHYVTAGSGYPLVLLHGWPDRLCEDHAGFNASPEADGLWTIGERAIGSLNIGCEHGLAERRRRDAAR